LDAVSAKLLGSPVDEKNSLVVLARSRKDVTMLWTIFVLLLILWLLGFSLHVGGGLIHLLLVVGLVVLVINLISGRRTAV
jgi:hypothetical protein